MLSGSACRLVPSLILPRALKTSGSIPYLMLCTEPSSKTALMPAGWAEPNCIEVVQVSPLSCGTLLMVTSTCGLLSGGAPRFAGGEFGSLGSGGKIGSCNQPVV